MNILDDFGKFARNKRGISSLGLHKYASIYGSYISPTIIEERQLNVASMDVFPRITYR
jgi:ATP-dependent Clp protease protease subunit